MGGSNTDHVVKVLDDTRQIIANLNLYAVAIDAHTYDLFDQVFTSDVAVSYSPAFQSTGRDLLKQNMAAFHEILDGSQHSIMNHQVIVDGDQAHSLAYVIVRLFRPMKSGESFYEMGGVYDDTHIRTAEGWRIKNRKYHGNWWHGNPRVAGTADFIYEPSVNPLRPASAAGNVDFLNAVKRQKG